MLTLNGITPVMATTFREDESIDDNALRKQIDFAVEAGAAAVCGPGFGAEFYKMSDAERYHFVEVLVEHTHRRVPTIAATSSAMMPGAACIEIYVRVCQLYKQGRRNEARRLSNQLLPYLSFAMQHLEVAIHTEKRVMVKRGILPNSACASQLFR